MPWSIDTLDSMALCGKRVLHADYNLQCQRVSRPEDWLARRAFNDYCVLLQGFNEKTRLEECLTVYMASPLKDYVSNLCTLSVSKRLQEIRQPQSIIRWSYSIVLEYMLDCTDKVPVNHSADLLEAVEAGFESYSFENPHRQPGLPGWLAESHFIVHIALRLVQQLSPRGPELRVEKALFYSLPANEIPPDDDTCKICHESLGQEISADEGFASPEKIIFEMSVLYPDFLDFVFNLPAAAISQPNPPAYTLLNEWKHAVQLGLMETSRLIDGLGTSMAGSRSHKKYLRTLKKRYKVLDTGFDEVWRVGGRLIQRLHTEDPFSRWAENIKRKHSALYAEELKLGRAIKLDCSHLYHRECVFSWLIGMKRGTCPYCREDIARYGDDGDDENGDDDDDDDENGDDDDDDQNGDENENENENENDNRIGLDPDEEAMPQDDVYEGSDSDEAIRSRIYKSLNQTLNRAIPGRTRAIEGEEEGDESHVGGGEQEDGSMGVEEDGGDGSDDESAGGMR